MQRSSVLNYLKDPLYLYHKIQFEQTWNRNNFEKKGKRKERNKTRDKKETRLQFIQHAFSITNLIYRIWRCELN